MLIARTLRTLVIAVAAASLAAAATGQVRVGSKNFTEQFVVAEIYAQALEAAGIKVERKVNLGGTLIAHKALRRSRSISIRSTPELCCWLCSKASRWPTAKRSTIR